MRSKHYHFIGIGGIGLSAIARYYKQLGYSISGSSDSDSELIHALQKEGMSISLGHRAENVPSNTDRILYTKAVFGTENTLEEGYRNNVEMVAGVERSIPLTSYPDALAEIVNAKKCIAITGSHGKSTTTAMTGIMLAGSAVGGSVLVGTQVPQLGGSNIHVEDSPYFAIEACEYKRAFLAYRPYITVITNIELDHLDYYPDIEDYVSAFQSLINQTSGYVVYDMDDENAQKLDFTQTQAKPVRVNQIGWSPSSPNPFSFWRRRGIELTPLSFKGEGLGVRALFPDMNLQVPGNHLLFDAKLAFVVGKLVGLDDEYIQKKLESYAGCWRRSEIIRTTEHRNILMSDYGHHPTEIRLTLEAIAEKYKDKKLFVAFQPHQHSRTRELLREFMTCFDAADELVIPDIYFSRDSNEDVAYMTIERFIDSLKSRYPFVQNGNGLENTLGYIKKYDRENPGTSVIMLLWAGDIDTLREEIT